MEYDVLQVKKMYNIINNYILIKISIFKFSKVYQ